MNPFTLTQSVKVLNGCGCISQLGELLTQAGFKKPLIVTTNGKSSTAVLAKAKEALEAAGIGFVEFRKVFPDPPAEIVDEGAALCKKEGCDCVIGLGGGSSIDTAKGINVLRFNDGSILEYAAGKPMKHCSGLIAIPTTSGTGSELSNGAIISDTARGLKLPVLCVENMPEYAVLDPELTATMPYKLTLVTGLDTFSHCYEAYTSKLCNPMTDLVCEKAMETIAEYLPIALAEPNNIAARERVQNAAALGGWMLYHACAHVGHSIAHVLGGKLHIIHGAACAYGTPAVLRAIAPAVPEKVKKIGEILGAEFTGTETPAETGAKSAEAYAAFAKKLGLEPVSKDGIDDGKIAELAKAVSQEMFAGLAPIDVDEALAEKMLREVFG